MDAAPAILVVGRRPAVVTVACELLAAAAVLPLLAAVAASLRAADAGYAHWWGSPAGWEILGRTVALAALAATLAVAAAWALATAAAALPPRLANAAALLSCLPLLLPSSLLGTAWIAALGRQGVLAPLLPAGLDLYSLPAAAAALALRYFGLAVVPLVRRRARLAGTWPAEQVFGVSRTRLAWLRLRAAARPAAVAWLLVALFAMNDHILPDMLQVPTYGMQVLIRVQAHLDPPGAAALAVPMGAVATAMLAAALLLLRRRGATAGAPAGSTVLQPRTLRWQLAAGAAAGAILAAALAVPVVVLACRAGSLDALGQAWRQARDEAVRTLALAAVAAVVCTLLAAALGGHWARCRREQRFSAVPIVLLNLTVPASLLGIGVIELTGRWPLTAVRDTTGPLAAACVVRFLPVLTLLFYAAWRSEGDGPLLAARLHGVGPWRSAVRVLWPARRAGLLAGLVLCALLVATELELSVLLAAAGASTLGVRLQSMIHTAPAWMFSALAVDVLLAAAPAILLLGLLAARWRGR